MLTSAPQYIVAFLDDGVDESYVQILTVPSVDELAIFVPEAENRQLLIELLWPENLLSLQESLPLSLKSAHYLHCSSEKIHVIPHLL